MISVTNGIYFHHTYNKTTAPLVLAYPSSNSNILVIWSDKMRWKQWMIENGFGKYAAKAIDLKKPSYPRSERRTIREFSKCEYHTRCWTIRIEAKVFQK